MTTPSRPLTFVFHRLQACLLQTAALVALASCTLPDTNGGLPNAPVPNVQGIYQGSYTYGGAYSKLAGETVAFEISLHQSRGSSKVTGVMREPYTGVGTSKDGFVWANISGTCVDESGMIHLQFTKTFRHSKEPPIRYKGTLPPGSSVLAGTWYYPDKPSDSGMFQISGMQAR